MNKTILEVRDKNIHQGMRKVQSDKRLSPDDYLELGGGWFTLPNFVENRGITFKFSTLKEKDKYGNNILIIDFIPMLKGKQKSLNNNPLLYTKIVRKLSILGSQFIKDIGKEQEDDFTIRIQQAEKWMLEND